MWRLVVDVIWRRQTTLARNLLWLVTVPLALAWVWAADGTASQHASAMAFSMVVAMALGPATAMIDLSSRVVLLLPLSRREIWRAGWVLSVVVSTVFTTIVKLAAWATAPLMLGRSSLTLSLVALSSLCDFLYTGAAVGIATRWPVPRWPGRRNALSQSINVSLIVLCLGSFVWSFALRAHLPIVWTGVRVGVALAMGIAACLTVIGYMHTPRFLGRAGGGRGRDIGTSMPSRGATLAFWRDFTGLTQLLWGACATTLLMVSLILTLNEFLLHTTSWWTGASPTIVTLVAFGVSVEIAERKTVGSLRHLRALPLSTRQLAGLITGVPLLQGLVAYIVAYVVAVFWTLSPPGILRPELLVPALGVFAIGESMSRATRLPRFLKVVWFLFVVGVAMNRPDLSLSLIAVIAANAAGVIATIVAIPINQRALSSSRIYKMKPYRPGFLALPVQRN